MKTIKIELTPDQAEHFETALVEFIASNDDYLESEKDDIVSIQNHVLKDVINQLRATASVA